MLELFISTYGVIVVLRVLSGDTGYGVVFCKIHRDYC